MVFLPMTYPFPKKVQKNIRNIWEYVSYQVTIIHYILINENKYMSMKKKKVSK